MKIFARVRTLAAAALALSIAGFPRVEAQQPAPPDREAAIQEIRQIQQRLSAVSEQAFQRAPALQQELEETEEAVSEAMRQIHPGTEQDIARLRALEGELEQAREAQDRARMESLLAEGSQIIERLENARRQALQRPDIKARIDAFETALVQQMTALDPETPRLIQRLETLAAQLR